MAEAETPNELAYSGSDGTIAPNPSWFTPTRRHIQSRILRSLAKPLLPVFVSLEISCSCCDRPHQSALQTWLCIVRPGKSHQGFNRFGAVLELVGSLSQRVRVPSSRREAA